jgi:tripartite-type tricarboxylate transporter receptor subunit TctC
MVVRRKPWRRKAMKLHLVGTLTLAVAVLAAGEAAAQNYPDRRVSWIVPFAPGGPTDTVSRAVGAALEQIWKQPVVIENRPGAGMIVGTDYAVRQPPDGHTLLLGGNGQHSVKIFVKSVPFEPNDLRPVAKLAGAQHVLAINSGIPAKTLSELVAYLKGNPKKANYGVIPMTTFELDYHRFMRATGTDLSAVPYNSAAPIMTALVRNEVQFYFAFGASIAPLLADGKVMPIAVLGAQRSERLPGVPTAREQGLDFVAGAGFGILVHSKTPEDIVRKLGNDIAAALKSPAVGVRLRDLGYDIPGNPLEWPAELQVELKSYFEMADRLGLKPQ